MVYLLKEIRIQEKEEKYEFRFRLNYEDSLQEDISTMELLILELN